MKAIGRRTGLILHGFYFCKTNRHAAGGFTDKPLQILLLCGRADALQKNLHNKGVAYEQ